MIWARIETRVFGDRSQFLRQFVAAVASLVEVSDVKSQYPLDTRAAGPA